MYTYMYIYINIYIYIYIAKFVSTWIWILVSRIVTSARSVASIPNRAVEGILFLVGKVVTKELSMVYVSGFQRHAPNRCSGETHTLGGPRLSTCSEFQRGKTIPLGRVDPEPRCRGHFVPDKIKQFLDARFQKYGLRFVAGIGAAVEVLGVWCLMFRVYG